MKNQDGYIIYNFSYSNTSRNLHQTLFEDTPKEEDLLFFSDPDHFDELTCESTMPMLHEER